MYVVIAAVDIFFIEQSSQGSNAIIIGVTTVIITMFNVIFCSFCCIAGFQYCSANREIRLRNANIIGYINTNMSLRDKIVRLHLQNTHPIP